MKSCGKCKEVKPLSEFYNYKRGPLGKSYRCKFCENESKDAYRAKHRTKHLKAQRDRNMKHKYGISREDYERMWGEQSGKCPICNCTLVNMELTGESKNKSETACVDHCHETLVVRGILCALCNKALGMFKDNIESLENAIKYLGNPLK